MVAPVRSLYALRPGAPAALVASTVATTAMFAATPFLIPTLADEFDVSEGSAGFISVAQVGGFAVASLVLGRIFSPSAGAFRLAATCLLAANIASAAVPWYPSLVLVRVAAGLAGGALAWVTWSDAMRTPRSMASISAAGPLTAAIGSPILAWLAEPGHVALYLGLAVVTVPLLALPAPDPPPRERPGVRSRSRSNRVLLSALTVLTMAGAGLFVYEAVIGREIHGLSGPEASWAFSLNALAGLAGAKLASRHRRPGIWLATAGPAALVTVIDASPVLFYADIAWWGFAFWMGVPGVMNMLAARSLSPEERAGDAQGLMALGRTVGPAAGGVLADSGSFVTLGIVSASGLAVSGVAVALTQEGRDRLPPTDPRTVRA